MAWEGFVKESKSYMGYPDGGQGRFSEWNHISVLDGGWTDKERWLAKLKFWRAFPRAWIKFYWSGFYYWSGLYYWWHKAG